jgi:hypothetical protein
MTSRALRPAAILLALAAITFATRASAQAPTVPTYGVRVYELLQRGPKLMLEERTTRAFAPNHVRNIAVGETFPAPGQPALIVYKSRDSFGFFGSYWREDGANDYGRYRVEVTEEGPGPEAGTALVRVQITERTDKGAESRRRILHPEMVLEKESRRTAPAEAAPTAPAPQAP